MNFSIISSCMHPWGGSEELWADAALFLQKAGHQVNILKTVFDAQHPRVQQLQAAGCQVAALRQQLPLPKRMLNRGLPFRRQWSAQAAQLAQVQRHLHQTRPQLVVVAQGSNFDGLVFADACRRARQPFVLLAQKAAEVFFPPWNQRQEARLAYQAARHCYFVAQHNLETTQNQLGIALPHASVVRNPFNVPYAGCVAWPAGGPVVQLACVARLEILDKGQDVLLQVLALPKWRQRPLHVTFYGRGGDGPALQDMAALLGLADRVTWAGQVADVAAIWASHHALVLASRYEGIPLALVEAALCGRLAIATAAGGTAELLRDNETGFLAGSSTVVALDEALERAWARCAEWAAIGRAAAAHTQHLVPADPGAQFGRELLSLV